MNRPTLLLADHDRDLRQRLSTILTAGGFIVVGASTEQTLRSTVHSAQPDLIILGDLPDTGATVRLIDELRAGGMTGEPDQTPVLVFTDDDDAVTLTRCILAGADDFRLKFTSGSELCARAHAILERRQRIAERSAHARTTAPAREPAARRLHVVGPGGRTLDVDPVNGTATLDGKPVPLTQMELALLSALANDPERVKTKAELLRDVWGYLSIGKTRTVDAHASRLRRKLADAGASGWVLSIRGIGYRLVNTTSASDDATA